MQAIRSYAREAEAERLRSEMGSGAADIAEIASEVRERLPDLRPLPALEPEQARFRLFDSVTSFLKAAGRHQPSVLVLEDLHWADRPSLLLLEFLARELGGARLLIVGSYRDVDITRQHPLALSLGELSRERLFQRVLLRGLGREDVAKFIELTAGITPPAGLVEAVHTQTEGNPLFVTEVVRLLVEEGALPAAGQPPLPTGEGGGEGESRASGPARAAPLAVNRQAWTVRIPEGVREVIGRRLSRLSERCNQVLTVAAVIGREFTLEQAGALVDDLPKERLLEVLEEALAARIIEELPRAVGRYQFTHALIQETLAEELTTTRRVQLHARIAEALESLYGDAAEAHAAELAHHYSEAQTVLGTDKLVHYCLVAGERALASHAYEEALGFFQRALAANGIALRSTDAAGDAGTAALLFGVGRAQIATFPLHQIPEAVTTMRRAFDYYERTGDVPMAVTVAEYPPPVAAGIRTGALETVRRALALAPSGSLEAARLLSLEARLLGLELNDYVGSQGASESALEIARRLGDLTLEMRALVESAEVDVYHYGYTHALERALLAINLAERADDPRAETLANYDAMFAAAQESDPTRALYFAEAAIAAAERLRHHFYLARALFGAAVVRRYIGDLSAARGFIDRALTVSPQEARALLLGALIEYEAGDHERGRMYLQRLTEQADLLPVGPTLARAFSVSAPALAAYVTGDLALIPAASKAGRTVVSSPSATTLVVSIARLGLAYIAVELGDIGAAREQYAYFDGNVNAGWVNFIELSSGPHLLGILASTFGDETLAARHFEDSLGFCRKAGYRPALAWTCVDYAHRLLEQAKAGGPDAHDHRARATELLDEGLTIARELGMKPLVERALRDKEFLSA